MNKQDILNYVSNKHRAKENHKPEVGDTIRVHVKIKEGNTQRVQVFEGVVISFKGSGLDRTMTVRKISFGVGVERIFPLHSPAVEKIKVIRSGHTRRAKLYYLRSRVGKSARLEEIERSDTKSEKAAQPAPQIKAVSDKKKENEELVAAREDS